MDWEAKFKALVRELDGISQGIYPQAVKMGGPNDYEVRTEKMNGWNEAVLDCTGKIDVIVERLQSEMGDTEDYDLLAASGACHIDEGRLRINLNDAFFWACSDCEAIAPEEIEEVALLYRRYGQCGLYCWAFKKQKLEKVEFKDIQRMIDFVAREEAQIAREPDSNKRAYMDLPEAAK